MLDSGLSGRLGSSAKLARADTRGSGARSCPVRDPQRRRPRRAVILKARPPSERGLGRHTTVGCGRLPLAEIDGSALSPGSVAQWRVQRLGSLPRLRLSVPPQCPLPTPSAVRTLACERFAGLAGIQGQPPRCFEPGRRKHPRTAAWPRESSRLPSICERVSSAGLAQVSGERPTLALRSSAASGSSVLTPLTRMPS